jgi:hypothetical protein
MYESYLNGARAANLSSDLNRKQEQLLGADDGISLVIYLICIMGNCAKGIKPNNCTSIFCQIQGDV